MQGPKWILKQLSFQLLAHQYVAFQPWLLLPLKVGTPSRNRIEVWHFLSVQPDVKGESWQVNMPEEIFRVSVTVLGKGARRLRAHTASVSYTGINRTLMIIVGRYCYSWVPALPRLCRSDSLSGISGKASCGGILLPSLGEHKFPSLFLASLSQQNGLFCLDMDRFQRFRFLSWCFLFHSVLFGYLFFFGHSFPETRPLDIACVKICCW